MNINIYEIVCYLLICNIDEDIIINLLKKNIKQIVMNKILYLDTVIADTDSPLGPGGPRGPTGP
jgi:hypothetical protein